MLKNHQGSAMTDPVSSVFQLADRHEVVMVNLKFCGLLGRWRHITIPASRLTPELFREGVPFDGSGIPGFARTESSDALLLPDPETAFLDPFWEAPTLSMVCGVHESATAAPARGDPRSVARRAEQHLRSSGLADEARVGLEHEFYLFDLVRHNCAANYAFYNVDSVEGEWNTDRESTDLPVLGMPIRGGSHAIPPNDRLYNLRSEMAARIEQAGVPVRNHRHAGGGPGQCGIEIAMSPLRLAADRSMLVKYMVRLTADKGGKVATFMPKPLHDAAGSGLQIHQNLWKEGKNLFWDEAGYAGLSATALHYIGGLLEHGPALLALTDASTNSYKRLVPGFEAPTHWTYGRMNRAAAIRVPADGRAAGAQRIEFRAADASGNAYLALSAMVMAGLDGVRRKIDPREEGFGPFETPASELPEHERARIRALPAGLDEALDALERDHQFLLEGGVFDEPLLRTWIALKREEALDVRRRPHPREVSLYLDV